ncbi:reverse transcriptase domain-containing protein [Tanacetum coccineum]|uniref:Reverse transcriptase domain-containing protein n=1 Tax=Tanacetum coccineum TaxID=301880 RepID=A0ABQ5CBF8_9ASTR
MDTKSCHQSSRSRITEPASERRYNKRASSRRMEEFSESEGSAGGHWKSKVKRPKSSVEDDLSQPWSAAKTERWAMLTWCHMFNSTLTGNARVWFDDLPKEIIDSYDDLKKAFLENYLQQKKCIKDPVKIHNIRHSDRESTEEFMRRITNPELIKRLYDKIPKSVDEMMRVTMKFLQGEVAASNRERNKSFPSWKQQEANQKQNFKKGGFCSATNDNPDRKKIANKFCEFHEEVGHNTDECMHLRKQIEEMLKAGKLSHLIKEIKQNNGKEQPKVTKKGETVGKDKAMAILMVQPWERVARQRITQSFSPNSKILFPPLGEDEGTEGLMIIEAEIGGHCMHRMYVDGGSALEILYEHCFSRLCPEIKNQLIPATTLLIRFSGEIIWPIGQIRLLVTIGDEEHSASALMNFVVVRSPSPYNGIIGRPGIRKLQAVPSNVYRMLKIQVEGGTIMIGYTLTEEGHNKLCSLLQQNLDVFAWKPADMTGALRHIAEHHLNVRKGYSRIRQKKRGQAAGKNQAIQEEVGKLVEAGIMREVHYHDWFSNLVMVKKHDNSWRMCVDFKDLNKACPKDVYPLPEIYWKMPFGLRNAGATYQRFVDKAFHKQIGRNLEVYVDDLVVKSRMEDEIVRDIEEMFQTLRENNMKLNPKKCTFGIEEGMFLGYKVSTRELIVYLAAAKETALRGPKVNYTSMEKLVLALVHASKRLKRYFQAYPIIVITDQQIQHVLSRPEVAGRLQKWSIELGEYAIHYRPRVSVKGLILADFIVERPEEESPDTLMEEEEELPEPWILFTDGSSCTDGSGAGLILTNPEGMEFTYALRFRFDATNNEVEYEDLIAELKIAEQMGVKNLQANVDSRLMANQVNGTYVAKEIDMVQYLEKVKTLTSSFKAFSIKQVPRSENKKADALNKIASTSFAYLSKQVLVEELKENSISAVEVLAVVEEEGDTWMTPIFKYLMDGTLPIEEKKARVVKCKSWRFFIINGTHYKKSFLGPWLRCVGPLQANYVLREIHEGFCSVHADTRSVVAKALRIGYYCPTMHEDARKLIRACQDC